MQPEFGNNAGNRRTLFTFAELYVKIKGAVSKQPFQHILIPKKGGLSMIHREPEKRPVIQPSKAEPRNGVRPTAASGRGEVSRTVRPIRSSGQDPHGSVPVQRGPAELRTGVSPLGGMQTGAPLYGRSRADRPVGVNRGISPQVGPQNAVRTPHTGEIPNAVRTPHTGMPAAGEAPPVGGANLPVNRSVMQTGANRNVRPSGKSTALRPIRQSSGTRPLPPSRTAGQNGGRAPASGALSQTKLWTVRQKQTVPPAVSEAETLKKQRRHDFMLGLGVGLVIFGIAAIFVCKAIIGIFV